VAQVLFIQERKIMDFSSMELSARRTLDDNSTTDKLWSQLELLEYAQDAENEACERADLIIDTESALTGIVTTSTTGTYGIASTVIAVKSALMANGSEPLMETSEKVLDNSVPGWRTAEGTPRSYVMTPTNNIIIYPIPSVASVLNLTVSRFPTTPMTVNGSPEIDSRYHQGLVLWMCYRAYLKNDSETLNTDKAADYLALFEKYFGSKKILND
jgi:hypothetical protein